MGCDLCQYDLGLNLSDFITDTIPNPAYSATRNSKFKICLALLTMLRKQNSKIGYDEVSGFINVLTIARSAIHDFIILRSCTPVENRLGSVDNRQQG